VSISDHLIWLASTITLDTRLADQIDRRFHQLALTMMTMPMMALGTPSINPDSIIDCNALAEFTSSATEIAR
jgi:hypothetical protein